MKKRNVKLRLSRETIRRLTRPDLTRVAAGERTDPSFCQCEITTTCVQIVSCCYC